MKRLLVVDDEETILFALQRYFTRIGFSVDCARELEEAEALAAFTPYDLVIADLSLTANGSTEGLEIVRYFHQNCPKVRVILLSGFGTPLIEREALRRGAHAFLPKPSALAELAQMAGQLTGERP